MTRTPGVLIVDDQPELRLLIRLTLANAKLNLREAEDGELALAACAEDVPDIVLLDVMLPGIDGYEVCRRLKADPRTAGTAIMLISAGAQATDRARAELAGADLFLAKPFSPSQLLQHVMQCLAARAG